MKKRKEIEALQARVAELEKLVRELQARPPVVFSPPAQPTSPNLYPGITPVYPTVPSPAVPAFPGYPIITCSATCKPALTYD